VADGNTLVPAHDLAAETSVLSAVLIDPEALDVVRDIVRPEDFYASANGRIYATALALDADGQPVDLVTVADRLRSDGRLTEIGGAPYLAGIVNDVPSTAYLEAHARIVAEKGKQRSVVALCQRLTAEGYRDLPDVTEWAQGGAQALADVAASGQDQDPPEHLSEIVPRVTRDLTAAAKTGLRPDGVSTGLAAFDRFTLGLERGKMHVLGGRPGMGKTVFTMQLALNVAAAGQGVVFVSAEMDKEELTQRALSNESRVPIGNILSGRVRREEWSDLSTAARDLSQFPLVVAHRPGGTIGQIRTAVRESKRKLGKRLGMVVVDYLQTLNGERERGETREGEVARLSRRLMWMAAEFDVALLAVSQLNRGVEARSNQNKRPSLSDLRESGAIEQDAYSVTLLYRDEYYNPGTNPGELEAIVAKMRGGKKGTVRLLFRGDITRVEDHPDPMRQIADEVGDFAENG
jgi:replicative DNA helicase